MNIKNNAAYEVENRLTRMFDKIESNVRDNVNCRADLYISDVAPLDRDTCVAMLQYAESLPDPTSEDLVNFVNANFSGKIKPVLESATLYPDYCSVKVLLARYTPTRKLDDVATLHPIVAGARYLDVELKSTWDVTTKPDGTKYLRRVSDDDVSAMVNARKQRSGIASKSANFTLASALASGIALADVGDTVRCYYQSCVYENCEITSKTKTDKFNVKIPSVGTVTVDRDAIVEITANSPEKNASMKQKLNNYYKEAFDDPQYAKELTKDMDSDSPESGWPRFAQNK